MRAPEQLSPDKGETRVRYRVQSSESGFRSFDKEQSHEHRPPEVLSCLFEHRCSISAGSKDRDMASGGRNDDMVMWKTETAAQAAQRVL